MNSKDKPGVNTAPTETVCRTKMILQTFKFTWVIDNFSFNTMKPGEAISSQEFPINENSEYKWSIKLYPYGEEDEDDDGEEEGSDGEEGSSEEYVACYIFSTKAPKDEVYAKYVISFTDSQNSVIKAESDEGLFFPDGDGYGVPQVIKRADLLKVLVDDSLKIHVEVTVSVNNSETCYEELSFVPDRFPSSTLATDIGSLLKDSKCSDVTICVEGMEIMAHQNILMARSKVFSSMFASDTLEKQTQRVEISDFEYDTIKDMLQFIYTGCLPQLEVSKAVKLLQVADKYQLLDLKTACCSFLISQICASNVMDFLVLADTHNDGKLKEKSIQFICANPKSVDFESYRPVLSQSGSLLLDVLNKIVTG